MKIAVSIPDNVFAEAERLTSRLKKSRSRLYTEAIKEYLARHDPDAITQALNEVYEHESSELDPGLAAVSTSLLARVEW